MTTVMESIATEESVSLERLLAGRHSCRAFLEQPVEQPVIEAILSIAQRTASWCNAQPWQVMITRGDFTDRLRTALSEHARRGMGNPDISFPAQYAGIYKDRRRECAETLYRSVNIEMGDREASGRQVAKNFRFFEAPHLAIVTTECALGTYGAVDCGAYVAMFLLACESFGVAAIPQAAIATQSDFLHEHLNIPLNRQIICGISFGYEDVSDASNQFRTSRAAIDEVVEWLG